MISLKLWRALFKPPRNHPLFHYVLSDAKREEPKVTSSFVAWVLLIAGFLFSWAVLFQPVLWVILAIFISLNSIYSVRWVLRIARTITREKETRRYDLLASLPVGLLGTSWALSTGALHKRSSFHWIPYLVLMVATIAFIALCSLSTMTLSLLDMISDGETSMLQNIAFARNGIMASPFVILFYVDHMYSILTAIVFGQLVTVDVKNTIDAQIRALLGFFVLQLLIYVITLGFAIYILPQLMIFFGFTQITHLIMIGCASVLAFVALREFVVYVLWHYLTKSLEADSKEIALVLKPFYEAEAILKESETARVRHMDAIG